MTEAATAFVTFVMPAHNAAATIERAVRCLTDQTSGAWRLVIVDDASTDDMLSICLGLANSDDRIEVVTHSTNLGAGSARNSGLARVATPYLGFIDADDAVDADFVERLSRETASRPADVVVFGIDEKYTGVAAGIAGGRRIVPSPMWADSATAARHEVITLEEQTLFGYQCTHVYKTSLIHDFGILFDSSRIYEDFFFNLAVMEHARSMLQLEWAPYHYTKGRPSITGTGFIPDYSPLSMRRIQSLVDAHRSWGLLDQNTLSRIGVLYLRYLLSSVARHTDPRSHMALNAQVRWLASAVDSPLDREVGAVARPTSPVLRLFKAAIQRRAFLAAVTMGRTARIMKDRGRPLYERLTRTEKPRDNMAPGPVRVLVYGMTDNPGGIESYLMAQRQRIDPSQLVFDFVTDFQRIAHAADARTAGSRIYTIPPKGRHPVGHVRALRQLLHQHPEWRTVYFNILDAGAAVSAVIPWMMRRRIVVHSHNSSTEKQLLHRTFRPLLNALASERFACSESAARHMYGTTEGTGIIPNAIEVERFQFQPEARSRIRRQLQLGDAFVVLYVGRFAEQKNPLRVVDIFAAVRRQDPSARLICVGGGPLKADLVSRIAELGLEDTVMLLGLRDDVPDLMSAADGFVLPSLFEGLPVVLIEAQASGLPAVTSTAVPRDAAITEGVQFIELAEPDEVWAAAIVAHRGRSRLDHRDEIAHAGYDLGTPTVAQNRLVNALLGKENAR